LLLFCSANASFAAVGSGKTGSLTAKQEEIAAIASFTAKGDLPRLKTELNAGLDAGLTINEIQEILVQMYAYCGFPRSLNGIIAFMEVLEGRKARGINDEAGKPPSPFPSNKSSYDIGREIQTKLVGTPVTGAIYSFAPAIDEFLKGHLFGDIFGRDNLDFQSRELATIAALASMEGVNGQLQAHFNIGFNTGLTEAQMKGVISVLEAKAGKREAANANEVLNRALNRTTTSEDKKKAQTIASSGTQASFAPTQTEEERTMDSGRNPLFGLGDKNSEAISQYFIGQSYVKTLTTDGVYSANVTFEPQCRNNWHIHHKGGQILMATDGRGWYQAWGEKPIELRPGDVVNIPAEVKHWHGAAKDSWFTHIAIAVPAEGASVEWLEPVSDEEYGKLK
jgi:alkylhydroperoxidase/carboxymuconolactone decarboxylase family protein YurZ/quercetin dioxygenase-like cupin family protein